MLQHDRRNYALIVMDNVFFTNAMTFLAVNTVITYFLEKLGARSFEIGLVNAVVGIGAMVTQPIFAGWATRSTTKLQTFARILFTQRIFLAAFIATIPWLVARSHSLTVWMFILCWGVFNLFTGSYQPFYISLFAKMIDPRQRGRIRGFSGALANGIALLSTVAIGVVLRFVSFPYNYTILFACGGVLLLLDVLDFTLMREPPDQSVGHVINPLQYLRQIPTVLFGDREFFKMVSAFVLLVVAQSTVAYVTLYAIRTFHATAKDVAIFTGVAVVVNIVSNLVLGIVADRFGHRLVLQVSAMSAALAGLLAISVHSLAALYVSFGLLNLSMSGYNLSATMLIIERSRKESMAMRISVNVMITLAVSSLFLLVIGYLLRIVGYQTIFWTLCATGLLAFVVLSRVSRAAFSESAR